jgi:tetratricopeptide (TPR) repeat protein
MNFQPTVYVLVLLCFSTGKTFAQYNSTSMEIISTSNSHARDCYYAATIAARIHYTSRKEIENCNVALNFTNLSLHDRAATLANRGIIYMSLEEYQKAIQDYTTAMKLRPDFGELYVNIGNVYFMGQVYDKAIQEYTNALDKNTSKSHIAYFNRGMAYEGLGNLDSAENDYRTATELMPEWSLAQDKLKELQIKKSRS